MLRRDMRLLGFSVLALGVRPPGLANKGGMGTWPHVPGTTDGSPGRGPVWQGFWLARSV